GLYEIMEKTSAYYIKSNYDIPIENVALVKNDEFPSPIFSRLLKNKKFYKRFVEVMHEMGDNIFSPSKTKKIIEDQKSNCLRNIIKTDW
ncbi:hypothetical protein PIROE2DRAFT_43423, partial [Piromyces sp. E2]